MFTFSVFFTSSFAISFPYPLRKKAHLLFTGTLFQRISCASKPNLLYIYDICPAKIRLLGWRGGFQFNCLKNKAQLSYLSMFTRLEVATQDTDLFSLHWPLDSLENSQNAAFKGHVGLFLLVVLKSSRGFFLQICLD